MGVPVVKATFTDGQREQLRAVGKQAGEALASMMRMMRVVGVRGRLRMLRDERRRLVREHRRRIGEVDEQIAATRAELAELESGRG